jgi:hypothetical protein
MDKFRKLSNASIVFSLSLWFNPVCCFAVDLFTDNYAALISALKIDTILPRGPVGLCAHGYESLADIKSFEYLSTSSVKLVFMKSPSEDINSIKTASPKDIKLSVIGSVP